MDIENQRHSAMESALRSLAVSDKSERALKQKLKVKGHDDEVINSVLDELKNIGTIDDEKLSARLASYMSRVKRLGKKRIYFELKKKSFSEENIRQALTECLSEDEEKNAHDLADQFWMKNENEEIYKKVQKLGAFLSRKGYDMNLIREIMDQYKNKGDSCEN